MTWKGGAESVIDVANQIAKFTVFRPLRANEQLFRQVKPGEWGWCAHWSDEMEMSSETLWRLALEQGAAWLRDWRLAHRMTQAQAAKAMGVSQRMWRYYEAGTHLLPKTVMLAAIGFDAQLNAISAVTNLARGRQWFQADIIFGQGSGFGRRLLAAENTARIPPFDADLILSSQLQLGRLPIPTPVPAAIDEVLVAAMSGIGKQSGVTAPQLSVLGAPGITRTMVN